MMATAHLPLWDRLRGIVRVLRYALWDRFELLAEFRHALLRRISG